MFQSRNTFYLCRSLLNSQLSNLNIFVLVPLLVLSWCVLRVYKNKIKIKGLKQLYFARILLFVLNSLSSQSLSLHLYHHPHVNSCYRRYPQQTTVRTGRRGKRSDEFRASASQVLLLVGFVDVCKKWL